MTGKITDYIKEQTCASVCCVDELGQPYCFSCFYIYNSDEGLLYYKSSLSTQHSLILSKNPAVAGTILPDKLSKLHVRGLQFEGTLLPFDHPAASAAASYYHRKNPMALAIPGEVWTIQVNSVKFTDSSLGFGKKLSWSREALIDQ
ncbi:MAG: pyridoxamine 5'-phosphate oxidase family protein [Chitinophagaceae bacterium]|nr:pyridoxamine 5'-phosphate oxidase family protein [Chitinophagaceae bacterium]